MIDPVQHLHSIPVLRRFPHEQLRSCSFLSQFDLLACSRFPGRTYCIFLAATRAQLDDRGIPCREWPRFPGRAYPRSFAFLESLPFAWSDDGRLVQPEPVAFADPASDVNCVNEDPQHMDAPQPFAPYHGDLFS
jgi:hypothetical protein